MAVKKAVAKTTPTKTAPAKLDAAGRRIKKAGEPPLARFADQEVTSLQTSFVEFIKAETGYDADPKSVQLGSVLRGRFQKSEANQARIAARREEMAQEAEEREARRIAREEAKAAKAAARLERETAKAEAEDADEAPKKAAAKKPVKKAAAPAKAAPAKPAAKKAAAKPARRRPAAVVEDSEEF